MPYIEIGNQPKNWVRFTKNKIAISAILRISLNNWATEKGKNLKLRLFYDEENKLFGIQPSIEGYSILEGRITSRALPKSLYGKYEALWNEKKSMIVIDLTKELR